VELRLEVGDHLARAADDQLLEGLPLEVAHERVAGVLEVVVLLLFDPALVARLRPAALVVLAEHVVVDLLDLAEAVGRAAEDARVAAVHERDAPALAPCHAGQRAHERGAADGHLVGDCSGQLHDLEELVLLAHEQREGVGAVGGQVVLEEVARPLERALERRLVVVLQALLLADAAVCLVDQGAHGGLPGRWRRELRGVEVEVEAQDERTVQPQLGEGPQLVTIWRVYLHARGSTQRVRGESLGKRAGRGPGV
jgi:hypothetical protein